MPFPQRRPAGETLALTARASVNKNRKLTKHEKRFAFFFIGILSQLTKKILAKTFLKSDSVCRFAVLK